jgi:hypothetical protein
MQPGALSMTDQSELARQFAESSPDRGISQAMSRVVDEKERRSGETSGSSGIILAQRGERGGMKRNQTQPTAFAFPHGEDGLLEINVIYLQSESFRNAQPRTGQQSEQRCVRPQSIL